MTEPQNYAPSDLNANVLKISQQGTGIDDLTKLAAGNPHLVTNPGLLQALVTGKATYAQASAINTFMAGMNLSRQVQQARATGQPLALNSQEQQLLDGMKVQYKDVATTPQQEQQAALAKANAEGYEVARDENGKVIYGADGTPVMVKKTEKSSGGGFWHDIGKVFSAIAKPFNVVGSTLGEMIDGLYHTAAYTGDNLGNLATGKGTDWSAVGQAFKSIAGDSDAQAKAMRDAGYDPNNLFSIIAYRAAGKDFLGTTNLANDWDDKHPGAGEGGNPSGSDMVQLAQRYISDPGALTSSIELNPNLTAEQKAHQLQQLQGTDFQDLVARVSGSRASIGDALIGDVLGLDPAKHPAVYNDLSTGIDFATALAGADPVVLAGKIGNAAKLDQVGLAGFKGAAFSQRINDILLSDTSGAKNITQFAKANVQRGFKRFIDNVNVIREASTGEQTAENAQKIAGAYADIRATTPALEPLIGDFSGSSRVLVDENGIPKIGQNGDILIGQGAPITNMQEAADYLSSKLNLARLASGRAAVEWNLMPGALSAFGYRSIVKASLANAVGKSAAINVGRWQDAMKVLPWANDAVDDSARVVAAQGDLKAAQDSLSKATMAHVKALAEPTSENLSEADKALKVSEAATAMQEAQSGVQAATEGLASARRAATAEVQFGPKLTGEVQQNLIRRGTIDGKGFNPGGYLAANAERAARRMSSFLPRNMHIRLDDASSTDKIYKFLQLYTSRADAALGAAKWAAADEGTRRAMIVGIQQQVMHAAGMGATEGGRDAIARVENLMNHPFPVSGEGEEGQRYAVNGEDVFDDPRLNGEPVHMGVLPGHVQMEWVLPSFAKLSQNAARSAIWRKTFGPMFQSKITDLMTFGFKTIQLMKPSTWTRNMLEGLGNAAFRGELGAVLRAKALTIEEGTLPDRHLLKLLNAKNWSPKFERTMSRFAPLARVGSWYRHAALRLANDTDGLEYIAALEKDELEAYQEAYSIQHLRADLDPGGLLQARGILKDGLTPQEVKFDLQHNMSPFYNARPSYERTGYKAQSAEGMVGADRWSGNLSTLVSDFPEYAKVLMDAAKADDGDVSAILAMIHDDPELSKRIGALRASHIVQDDKFNTTFEVRSPEDQQKALEQLARKQVSVVKGMLTSKKDGRYLDEVDGYIRRHNRAPSANWLMDNVPDAERPFEVLAPTFVARPPQGGIDGFAAAISQVTDKWYRRLVEEPIQRTTSLPVFLANYGKARYYLSDAEDDLRNRIVASREAALDKSGMSKDEIAAAKQQIEEQAKITADALMKQRAIKMSWVRTEQIIDDPGLKTQFDVTGRNFFMYSRATQAMIRRWGQAILQDPTRLEKAALALHAAEHTGLIYNNKYGELSFVYPGSGPLINGITKLTSVLPGFGSFSQLPVVPNLTGQVLFAAPGLDNPLRMGLSPIVNTPYRMVEAYMPAAARANMDDWDRFINGPVGAGQIGSQFMPAGLRNLFADLSPDERKSQWASAMNSAISNLIAADPSGTKGIVPGPNASKADIDAFLARLKTQTKNALAVRWALGLFMPASPSLPTMDTKASASDPEYNVQGYKDLRSEYQKILDDFNGDYNQANQLWAALHPDDLVYETGLSHSTAKGVPLPADDATFRWLEENEGFLKKYGATAAYFIPQTDGQFSDRAYQDELALGLRQKYSPNEFYSQVRINQGANVYWPSSDAYQAQKAALKASGQSTDNLDEAWAQWSQNFKATNPLFTDSLDAVNATNGNNAADNLGNLREMLTDPKSLPSSIPAKDVEHMIGAYDQYEQWRIANVNADQTIKNQVTAAYQAYMSEMAAKSPSLTSLYNGIFRPLSPELTSIAASGETT